jgi:hypothetical protein
MQLTHRCYPYSYGIVCYCRVHCILKHEIIFLVDLVDIKQEARCLKLGSSFSLADIVFQVSSQLPLKTGIELRQFLEAYPNR